MSKNGQSERLFDRLKTGLEEGIQFARGELSLRTIEAVDPPPDWSAREITRLRKQYGMSQVTFAQLLNVSGKTIQSWEQGNRAPSQAALRLLQILKAQPEAVRQAVGLGEPTQ